MEFGKHFGKDSHFGLISKHNDKKTNETKKKYSKIFTFNFRWKTQKIKYELETNE